MPDTERARQRHAFVERHCGTAHRIEPASADASFRSYWRVQLGAGDTRIVMDAPPAHEDVRPWLDVCQRLRAAHVHAPEVFAADADSGFLLLEDLGNATFLPALSEHSADALYGSALDALLRMQRNASTDGLPDYDDGRLVAEMELMPTWFVERHLGASLGCEAWDVVELAFRHLADNALQQPRVFVHRDYHSRNLLVTPQDSPGVIDFQDAVRGPLTYDLVSLLRDCYIAWPTARVDAWVEAYRQRLVDAGLTDADARTFRRWFDLMGVQRHVKVLGIFCRLWYRDGKAGYLRDLPLVWRYVHEVSRQYPQLHAFAALLERLVGKRDLTVPRAGAVEAAAGTRLP